MNKISLLSIALSLFAGAAFAEESTEKQEATPAEVAPEATVENSDSKAVENDAKKVTEEKKDIEKVTEEKSEEAAKSDSEAPAAATDSEVTKDESATNDTEKKADKKEKANKKKKRSKKSKKDKGPKIDLNADEKVAQDPAPEATSETAEKKADEAPVEQPAAAE